MLRLLKYPCFALLNLMREALMRLPYICRRQTYGQTAEPFLTPVSSLLEPLRLGEEAPEGYSRKNVYQWTTLFEPLPEVTLTKWLKLRPKTFRRKTQVPHIDEFIC